MDRALLTRTMFVLKQHGHRWLLPEQLAPRLNCSTAKAVRAIADLRRLACEIEHDPARGFRWRAFSEKLVADEVRRHLGTRVVGRDVLVLDSTPSTNDAALAAAQNGARAGTAVFAEAQTSGRGRMGRGWVSPAGKGLWLTVLLEPAIDGELAPLLTIGGAVAVAETAAALGLDARIRWPNDVVINEKKLAGVLVEARQVDGRVVHLLGAGINVNFDVAEMPAHIRRTATSLMAELDCAVDRTGFARALLGGLDTWYGRIEEGQHDLLGRRWREMSMLLEREVVIEQRGRTFSGTVVDLDPVEGITLRPSRGSPRVFRGEHVTLKSIR